MVYAVKYAAVLMAPSSATLTPYLAAINQCYVQSAKVDLSVAWANETDIFGMDSLFSIK